ncbi:unnamed protein product [Lampetra planeri]
MSTRNGTLDSARCAEQNAKQPGEHILEPAEHDRQDPETVTSRITQWNPNAFSTARYSPRRSPKLSASRTN